MNPWSVKKEILLHLAASFVFFTPFILLHPLFDSRLILFALGALLGTFLPDIDHVIYALFLKPKEITSQRVQAKVASRDFKEALSLLFSTRHERSTLIFHTMFFQCLFLVFSFLVITSSGSLFGRSLVLAFLLSLLVDEALDIKTNTNISGWLYGLPLTLTVKQFKKFFLAQAVLLFLLGYIF